MARIVIELTNRCNLRCGHCLEARHGGHGDLTLSILDRILDQARQHGFDELAFTGGEPTLHKHFPAVVENTVNAGYAFGFVTNGWSFPKIYPWLLGFRSGLTTITFSMDGAREATHDGLRGKGSYRRVLQAMSICALKDLPFTVNMVVTRNNSGELEALVDLVAQLGSRGARFGHLMPTPDSSALELSGGEKRAVEERVGLLARTAAITVAMAPGYYTEELFPCAPLEMQEFNIDWQGNVSLCCHLSGYDGKHSDVVGNLRNISFSQAVAKLKATVAQYRLQKEYHRAAGNLSEDDHFPCLYCCRHFEKLETEGTPASVCVTQPAH